jgi:hypothetical protein
VCYEGRWFWIDKTLRQTQDRFGPSGEARRLAHRLIIAGFDGPTNKLRICHLSQIET